ncbi:hypothetical protein ACIGXM_12945 [Kitasatospora sp. NPDC052896]|uniref:hypothetical protein n=1 Tax=Kitasatospora sp. NPDC052896 TaxID=3364061 RepID=UPI0037CBA048
MSEMAFPQPRPDGLSAPGFTDAQLTGLACLCCASPDASHHGETVTTCVADDVVRDTTVRRRPPCPTTGRRYRPEQLPPDDRGWALRGVREVATGGWIETDGELEQHTLLDGADAWIQRQRYLDQATLRTSTGAVPSPLPQGSTNG